MKPVRIQRSRRHKQVSPNGLPIVYVGRPTKWGNPYKPGCLISESYAKKIVQQYRDSMSVMLKQDAVKKLRGKNLSCWCKLDQPCHADVLLEIANK